MSAATGEETDSPATIFCIGASHKTAPIALRDRLAVSEGRLAALLPSLRDRNLIAEIVVLSTCNRSEIYGVSRSPIGPNQLQDLFLQLYQDEEKPLNVDVKTIRDATYWHFDVDAIRHMFRVAASLDSLVVGETQITGQFKDAVALANEAKTAGALLGRLTQEALAAAKRVRTQTEIGRRHVSISSAAIDLAKKVFGDLSRHRFLVIGAGEMASVACRHIETYKPRQLMVVNRTYERGARLVRELGFGNAASLEGLFQHLCETDVVITATGAPGYIITDDLIRRVQKSRGGRQLFMIDIALPRDIDPACGDQDEVYLFDIDDLQQVVGKNTEERRNAASAAEALVEESVQNFSRWLQTLSVKPALASFRAYLNGIVARESARSFERDALQQLSDKQRAAIQGLLEAIVSRISGDSGQQMKALAESGQGREAAALLRQLFPEERDRRREAKDTP